MDELNQTTETTENENSTAMTVEFVEKKTAKKEKAVAFAAGAASGLLAFFGIKKLIDNRRKLKALKAEKKEQVQSDTEG